MSELEITLSLILAVSIILNIGLYLYLRGVLFRLLTISEEMGDFQNMVNSFASHLKNVYELEMFYGDQTLAGLLNHAVSFNEQLETFEFIYSLTEEELQNDNTTNTENEEAEEAY